MQRRIVFGTAAIRGRDCCARDYKGKVSIYLSQNTILKKRTNLNWRPCNSLDLNEARPPVIIYHNYVKYNLFL